MKTQKTFDLFEFRVDALEYLFVEWLVRNNLYCKYARNLKASGRVTTSVGDCIRSRVRLYASNPCINYSFFLTGSFNFTETPEGPEFWIEASQRWENFCKSFFPF